VEHTLLLLVVDRRKTWGEGRLEQALRASLCWKIPGGVETKGAEGKEGNREAKVET